MVNLIIGLIYLVFMTMLSVAICDDTTTVLNIIVLLFASPGVALTVKGVKEINRLKRIQLQGETCYARINGFTPLNSFEDSYTTFHEVEFLVYLPSTNEVKKVRRKMDIYRQDIKVGNYVECKYLKGDINISDYLDYVEIPMSAKEEINKYILEDKKIQMLNK